MSTSKDVESQSPVARSRSRCLDIFLITSVVALFVMFIIALGGAFAFARHIYQEINALSSGKSEESVHSAFSSHDLGSPTYKMQNFAYLEPTDATLKNGVIPWKAVKYGEGESVGSLYSFRKSQEALIVKEHGSFFMYVQLNFTCVHQCPSGQFKVNFNSRLKTELTCSVELPKKEENQTISKTCWNVATFMENETNLLAKSYFTFVPDQTDPLNWKLEFIGSGFGIFKIDGLQAAHHS